MLLATKWVCKKLKVNEQPSLGLKLKADVLLNKKYQNTTSYNTV
jgi:hypothetical protein